MCVCVCLCVCMCVYKTLSFLWHNSGFICPNHLPVYSRILLVETEFSKIWILCFPYFNFSLVQLLSCVQLIVKPWTAARQASLSITNSQRLLKLMSIESVMPSHHLILCRPLLLLPSIFLNIRVFLMSQFFASVTRYWSCSISPSNEYSGLISFRIDWFDLLAVQGTLKSLLQYHSSKA